MKIMTIFVTPPDDNLARHQMSFAEPYSDDAEKKMIAHTLKIWASIKLSAGRWKTEFEFVGIDQLWEQIDWALEGTGWTLFVIDSEVQA